MGAHQALIGSFKPMATHIALAKLCWALGTRKSSEQGKEIWKEGEGLRGMGEDQRSLEAATSMYQII